MIATFTDFGSEGPYLGQMKAVLYQNAPAVPVVDVFPDLPPYNVKAAAYLLPAYSRYLPEGTVCLCVVDPGVGSERRALVLRADQHWFVGPDNGLFSILMRRAAEVQVFEISWRPHSLSNSFHGRDLFAPVAGRLAAGEWPGDTIIEAGQLVSPSWPDDLPQVVYLDSYGNAITGLRASSMPRDAVIGVKETSLSFCRTFADAETGTPFWYENSNGLVEMAVANGHAGQLLRLEVGSSVEVKR